MNPPDRPMEVYSWQVDLGFLGVQKDFPAVQKSSLPIKKKRNQSLTYEEAVYNKNHYKRRI